MKTPDTPTTEFCNESKEFVLTFREQKLNLNVSFSYVRCVLEIIGPTETWYYPAPDTIGDGVLFSIDFFVYFFVCFFVIKITRKWLDQFAWNFQGRCGVTTGRPDYIFGHLRETARCYRATLQHGGGVCCASHHSLFEISSHDTAVFLVLYSVLYTTWFTCFAQVQDQPSELLGIHCTSLQSRLEVAWRQRLGCRTFDQVVVRLPG